jgi:lipid A disaccharide synthetase
LPLQRLGLVSRFAQTDIQIMGVLAVLKSLPTLLSRITDTADAVVDLAPRSAADRRCAGLLDARGPQGAQG